MNLKNLPESEQEALFHRLDNLRNGAKTTNYSALYGVGAKKLARTSDVSVSDAQTLLDSFWKMNWSIEKVAKAQYIKKTKDGRMWLQNPISGFYHNLRFEKDIFSTLNQSTGVYCFDRWVALARANGIKICCQMHDEIVVVLEDGQQEGVAEILNKAIDKLNDQLKLNVDLGIDMKFGKTYAGVH